MTRIQYLNEVAKLLPENPVCIELGVFRGEFSNQIYHALNPKLLYLVDQFELNTEKRYDDGQYVEYSNQKDFVIVAELFKSEIETGSVHIIQNDSLYSSFFFPNKYFDFIYVDASHLAEDVIKDLVYYESKLKHGGLLCGHDYNAVAFPGVGIAVDSFCEQYNFDILILNMNGGDYALKRK